MKKTFIALALSIAVALPVSADVPTELLVTLNSGNPQTQGMALVLATQAAEQKAGVRVLLCSEGGQLALKVGQSVPLKPRNVTPKEMLQGLLKAGARVEVCALFLPNSDWKPADLLDGIGVAKPGDVAAYLLKPNVKILTY